MRKKKKMKKKKKTVNNLKPLMKSKIKEMELIMNILKPTKTLSRETLNKLKLN